MNTYFRLLSFAKPIERYAIPYVICTIITVFFSTMNLALLAPLLTTLFDSDTNAEVLTKPEEWTDVLAYFNYYAQEANFKYGAFGALKKVSIAIVISVLLSNTFRYLSQRIMENLKIHTLLNLRRTVFNNVMDLHVGFFNNQRKGDIISKITSDVQVVQYSVTATLQVVFKEPLQLIAYFAALFLISVKLTIFAVLVIPISAFFISRIVKKLKSQATLAQEVYGNMVSFLDEALSGIKIIKAFNATDFVKNRFNDENEEFSKIGRRMVRRQQLGSPVSEFLGVIMVVVIVLYGGNLVINQGSELSAADFVTYIAIFSQVMRPAKALTDSFSNINSGIAAGERVLELIDNRPEIKNNSDAKEMNSFQDSINFKTVSFSYNEEREILSDINITIPKGKMVALVGPSGGGKSTLMDLLPRFIDPNKGQLLIDGEDIKNINIDSLRSLMGTVNQELILFNDTIFNNISFGIETSQAEVEAAAKIANAHDFILETENGYQTNIGDRGVKLSGGQKQRICIARAILRNPPILLLDEATSALDTESEKLVQSALNNLMKNRTSLVIAHRLSTIQQADHIYVLDGGRIVEEGTHLQLVEKDGLYRKLIEMQQFEQNTDVKS